MKTKMKYLALILSVSILGACSSSLQMSQSGSYQGDDLYYNPSEKYTAKSTTENDIKSDHNSTDLKFAELEKKYTEILANDTTGTIDTTIYKSSTSDNPYERILSDSYQDSYERRLRGRANPYYGLGSWSYLYSDDYWYASSFRGDPYYNVIVMGSDVWVEPFYISSMFGWPYSGFGFYSNYSYYWGRPYMSLYHAGFIGWAYGSYYSIWHYNDYAYGYNSGYWNGYYNNNLSNSPNYHYGRRPETGVVDYGNRPIQETASSANFNDRRRDMSEKQATFSNDKNRRSDSDLRGETRGDYQDPTKVTTRPAKDRDVREPSRDSREVSRPLKESLNVNPTRVNSDRESSREHNPSYSRPNPGYSNEFNRPNRSYPQTEPLRNRGNEKISSPSRTGTREVNRSYNPPPRITPPSNSSDRGRSVGGSSNISRPPASRSGSSVAPSRSSSGSSSGSSSRSSGSSSSSSNSSNSSSGSSRSRSR